MYFGEPDLAEIDGEHLDNDSFIPDCVVGCFISDTLDLNSRFAMIEIELKLNTSLWFWPG